MIPWFIGPTLACVFLLWGFRRVRNDRIGIVEKRFSQKGSLHSGLIALAGEAGYQPEVLRGGYHFRMPFQFRIRSAPLATIPQGRIGYVCARDGIPLGPEQTLGRDVAHRTFDLRSSLPRRPAAGQRGARTPRTRSRTWPRAGP